MVVVTFAFVLFAGLGGCRVVVRVGVCMLWTLAHSVGYADVNEVVSRACGAGDVHDGFAGLPLFVGVVQLGEVLFSVACVPHVAKPSVECVAEVVVFSDCVAAYCTSQCVVSVWV